MANLKKSGIWLWLTAFCFCIGMSGQMIHASAGQVVNDGTGRSIDAGAGGSVDPGTGEPMDAGAGQPADAGTPWPAEVRPVRPEAGIIEVQSGVVDTKGKFWKMRSGSGFLIANKDSATYVVTNSSNVSNTPNQIKKFCKKHSINTENMQITNTIRVVITGDVMAEAEVVVKSAERDYCVLSAANVVSQKESLKIGDSTGIMENDLVYAYGFPEPSDSGENPAAYSEQDVLSMQGAVTQPEAYQDSGTFVAHSAPFVQGFAGGPLLDADGYVIGLNCRQSPEDDTGISYALPINEICAVLDNFSIYYGSRAIDEAYTQLMAAYQECTRIQSEGGYKNASMEALTEALTAAAEVMELEEPTAADYVNASEMLITARDALVPKTPALTIAMTILAVCDLILFLWMLVLAVKNAREKKQMEMRRVQPALQGAGYPGQQAAQGRDARRSSAAANAGSSRQAGMQGAGCAGQQAASNAGAGYIGQQAAPNAGAGYVGQQAAVNAGYAGRQGAADAGYAGRQAVPDAGYARQQGAQNAGYAGQPPHGADHFRQPVAPPAGRRLRMIRQKTGQTVVLNKNQFIVGKSQTLADFCIADNQTISRKHAMLFEDNGGWYVDDLNSLNGTCVNGTRVVPGQAVRLKGGDAITLSDEAFLVQD